MCVSACTDGDYSQGFFGEGVCRGKTSPMMGGFRVVLVARPWSVASLGRANHAFADSTLHRAMMPGQHYLRSAPGIDGVGSNRHRSQACTDDTVVNLRSWAGEGGRGDGASVKVFLVYSQDRVLQRFVEQNIDEDVGMEEIFKVFSQDSEWVWRT